MKQEDVIRLATQARLPHDYETQEPVWLDKLEAFAKLVAEHERERIKQANKPELEKCNAYIKELEKAVIDEREACAKIADSAQDDITFIGNMPVTVATAIRARGQT
jgi:hypothetical protein